MRANMPSRLFKETFQIDWLHFTLHPMLNRFRAAFSYFINLCFQIFRIEWIKCQFKTSNCNRLRKYDISYWDKKIFSFAIFVGCIVLKHLLTVLPDSNGAKIYRSHQSGFTRLFFVEWDLCMRFDWCFMWHSINDKHDFKL